MEYIYLIFLLLLCDSIYFSIGDSFVDRSDKDLNVCTLNRSCDRDLKSIIVYKFDSIVEL